MKAKDFMLGAFVGGVVGAVTALLLAPKPGREVRADIAFQVEAITEKTKELAGNVSDISKQLAKSVGSNTARWVDKANDFADSVVDEAKTWRDNRRELANSEVTATKSTDLE